MLQWVTRQSAELQNQLISIERVEQYSSLEPEEGCHLVSGRGKGELAVLNFA
jgi:hypothetical protein